jgi:hypothetical protein
MKPKQEHNEYKTRHIRMSDEVWEKLKENRRKSGLSWNLFIKHAAGGEIEVKPFQP